MKRLHLAVASFAVAVLLVGAFLIITLKDDGPQEVLETYMECINEGDARGAVDCCVFSLLPEYEAMVNFTQEQIVDKGASLSNLSVHRLLYYGEMNQSEKAGVTDYMAEFIRDYGPISFSVDDYCLIFFTWDISVSSFDVSFVQETTDLFLNIEDKWYMTESCW